MESEGGTRGPRWSLPSDEHLLRSVEALDVYIHHWEEDMALSVHVTGLPKVLGLGHHTSRWK